MTAPKPSLHRRLRWWLGDKKLSAVTHWRTACDWLKWLGHKPGNLERHAERELRLAGWFGQDGFYGDMMGHAVLRMIREFSEEGHSGMSAPTAVALFEEVAMFKPLTPLTGEDDEWIKHDYGDDVSYQNKRCGHVFKSVDGRAYDSRGRVFREPSGVCYTCFDSRVYIEFPYMPKVEYVDVPDKGEDR